MPEGRPAPQPLPAPIHQRLDRFFERLECLPISDLPMYAARPLDAEGHRRAIADAELVAIESGREGAVAEHRERTAEWLRMAWSSSGFRTQFPGAIDVRGTERVEDRLAVVESLQVAILGLAVADHLPPETLDELLGPWADLEG